jgi:hypothetical protein
MCGWWWTAPITPVGEVALLGHSMRFWLGHVFSLPYIPGVDREVAMERAVTPMSSVPPDGMAWLGLCKPAAVYPYELHHCRWLPDMGSPIRGRIQVIPVHPAFTPSARQRVRVLP